MKKTYDQSLTAPEYVQIQAAIKRQIEEGILQNGERLPSDRALANAYGVSIGTIVKSVTNLANLGFVKRVQGKGTYVVDLKAVVGNDAFEIRRTGFSPEDSSLIQFGKLDSIIQHDDFNVLFPEKKYFGSEPTPVYEIRRYSENLGTVYCLSVCYLSSVICPNIDKIPASEFENNSLRKIYRERYGIAPSNIDEMTSIGLPGDELSLLWGDRITEPFLCVESIEFTGKNKPFIYRIVMYFDRKYKLYRRF